MGRLNFHWVGENNPLGRVPLGLLQRGVSVYVSVLKIPIVQADSVSKSAFLKKTPLYSCAIPERDFFFQNKAFCI